MLIKMDPGAGITEAELKRILYAQLKADGFRIASIQTTNEQHDNMQSNFNSILILLVLIALLLAVAGGLGLMGTMSINGLERTREIGVLRAIGASDRGVNSVFLTEGVGIGMSICLIAIPVSFPIISLAASTIGQLTTGSAWAETFTTSGVFIWIVIVSILSLLANYFPARSATRLTVCEVLAYE